MFATRGKLIGKSLIKEGESEKGKWRIISFLLGKTMNKKKVKIPFIARGSLAEKVMEMPVGERVRVEFVLDGHEYNGKWYPDIQAHSVEKYIPPSKVNEISNKIDSKDNQLFRTENYGQEDKAADKA